MITNVQLLFAFQDCIWCVQDCSVSHTATCLGLFQGLLNKLCTQARAVLIETMLRSSEQIRVRQFLWSDQMEVAQNNPFDPPLCFGCRKPSADFRSDQSTDHVPRGRLEGVDALEDRGEVIWLAGIWTRYERPSARVESCAVITRLNRVDDSRALIEPKPEEFADWLEPKTRFQKLEEWLQPIGLHKNAVGTRPQRRQESDMSITDGDDVFSSGT
jgi:hypothetical protein